MGHCRRCGYYVGKDEEDPETCPRCPPDDNEGDWEPDEEWDK